nr:MAG TPA: hypothetical protein [Caudoviricetes sp.]DAK96441.1 MAG TPA: hypothetical protein [Caudoviricetes sp.]
MLLVLLFDVKIQYLLYITKQNNHNILFLLHKLI